MKKTVERTSALNSQPKHQSDLSHKPTVPEKPPRRKNGRVRLNAVSGAPSSKRSSRPDTPLLKWKPVEVNDKTNSSEKEEKSYGDGGRKNERKVRADISARKLAASSWRLQLPEFQSRGDPRMGHQSGDDVGAPIHGHRVDRVHNSHNLVHSPYSRSCPSNGLFKKFDPSSQFPNSAMEGTTKWDPVCWNTLDESKQILNQSKLLEKQAISALERDLEQARARINELESERKPSKNKLEQFLQKLSEERATWRSREHEKIHAIIEDMKADMNREKKNRHRLEIVNSKLVNELTELKLSTKRFVHEYGKERKARELIEEVCDELAKEIGEDKAEAEALKKESMELQEKVEEERKMLQMAEVWHEERVQMKLIDAKVMLEEKFSQMNGLVAEIEHFLKSSSEISDLEQIKKAEFFKQMVASVSIQDVRELKYEPPNPDDIFSIFETINFNESNEKKVELCSEYSPEVKMPNKKSALRHSDKYVDQSEDTSEWETVSHVCDQGSSFSPEGSDRSMNENFRVSGVSRSGTEWERSGGEETPVMEINEVGSKKTRQMKKISSISKLWKSRNGDNYKTVSTYGIERAGGAQISSLKSRLLEARMENQKIQLRQVLKQKI